MIVTHCGNGDESLELLVIGELIPFLYRTIVLRLFAIISTEI